MNYAQKVSLIFINSKQNVAQWIFFYQIFMISFFNLVHLFQKVMCFLLVFPCGTGELLVQKNHYHYYKRNKEGRFFQKRKVPVPARAVSPAKRRAFHSIILTRFVESCLGYALLFFILGQKKKPLNLRNEVLE